MTTTFDLVLNGADVHNDEDALDVFNGLAGEVANVDFEYDFDYEFLGYSAEGFAFNVSINTQDTEEAYEVMQQKFVDNVPSSITVQYQSTYKNFLTGVMHDAFLIVAPI